MSRKKTGRRMASKLVADAATKVKRRSWLETLSEEDRAYVYEVASLIPQTPGAAIYPVADQLIAELKLTFHRGTVFETLRELIRNGKA